jgi:preprotein translocase subunit SecG
MTLLLFVHVVVCVLLVLVVLLQSGKSADLAGAFGGYGSQSTFGPRGTASMLSKMTTTLAVMFMVTSMLLWMFSGKKARSSSILGGEKIKQEQRVDGKKRSIPARPDQSPSGQLPADLPKSGGVGNQKK